MESCTKVWQAFEKLLYDQVVNKGRLVDSQLAGLFFRLPTQQHVTFMPSPEYVDAGKFKVQRLFANGGDTTQTRQYYQESYAQMLADSVSTVQVSFASISAVTSVAKDLVHKILSDVF